MDLHWKFKAGYSNCVEQEFWSQVTYFILAPPFTNFVTLSKSMPQFTDL